MELGLELMPSDKSLPTAYVIVCSASPQIQNTILNVRSRLGNKNKHTKTSGPRDTKTRSHI